MDLLNGDDITRILNSAGPIVTCVLILPSESNNEEKEDIITEVRVDTTPQKREVENVLGGPITFLGQYIEEGVVVMTKKEDEENDTDTTRNRIKLPMPLHEVVAYSALVMKVSQEDDDDDNATNEDFFLDYSKEKYLDLVNRGGETRQEPIEEDDEGEQSNDEVSDDDDGDLDADSDGVVLDDDDDYDDDFEDDDEEMDLDSEEERIGMLNLCMGQVLRRFHQENGHGPDTRQLLEMRHALASKLGVDLPSLPPDDTQDLEEDAIQTEDKDATIDDIQPDNNDGNKRMAAQEDTPRKRVKWSSYVDEQEIEMVSVEEQDMATDENEDAEEQMAPSDEQHMTNTEAEVST